MARSAAHLSIASDRPAPPADLSDREKAIWTEIVASKPSGWFDAGMFPLLRALCSHASTAEDIQRELSDVGDMDDLQERRYWIEKLLKMRRAETAAIASLSVKLRLSAQSRYTPGAAASAVRGYRPRPPGENRFSKIAARKPGAKK